MSPASAKETHVRVGGSDLYLDQGPSWRRRDLTAERQAARAEQRVYSSLGRERAGLGLGPGAQRPDREEPRGEGDAEKARLRIARDD